MSNDAKTEVKPLTSNADSQTESKTKSMRFKFISEEMIKKIKDEIAQNPKISGQFQVPPPLVSHTYTFDIFSRVKRKN